MIGILKRLDLKSWILVFICLILVCGQVYIDLKVPDYMQDITTQVTTPGSEITAVLIDGGKMLLCVLCSLTLTFVVGFFAARIAAGLSRKLRSLVFKKTLSFSMEEINTFSTASLITRSTNDITQIQFVIALGLQAIIRAPITVVLAVGKMSTKHVQFLLATGGGVLFLVAMLLFILLLAMPKFKLIQKLTDKLNLVTRENLTGLRVVRAYNAEGYQTEKFEAANDDLTANNLFTQRVMSLVQTGMNFLFATMVLATYWIGAHLINTAGDPLGPAALIAKERVQIFSEMVTYSTYSMHVVMSFMMLAMVFVLMPRVAVSAVRINAVLDTKARINDGEGAEPADEAGTIEFKNVSFRYPDGGENVLEDISFSARAGETVAIIGPTGSGKSTLINLIARFYDVTDGQVFVDGADVREYRQRALRNRIGYISQRATLFYGTVSSNIAFGDNGRVEPDEENCDELVRRAVRIAQSEDFVEALDGGLDARISQGGANLSGGQKQRVSIARAVYRDPSIYIFDDSFSALDYRTDRALRSALARETAGATKIIVAQRIGTIKDADRIIVLDEGRVAGIGKHRELLQSCDIYREIALSQLSKEELE